MRRHRFDPISAIFGLTFVSVGIGFLSDTIGFAEISDWMAPAVVLLVGMSFVFRALSRPEAPASVVQAPMPPPLVVSEPPLPLTDAELAEAELRRELAEEAKAAAARDSAASSDADVGGDPEPDSTDDADPEVADGDEPDGLG